MWVIAIVQHCVISWTPWSKHDHGRMLICSIIACLVRGFDSSRGAWWVVLIAWTEDAVVAGACDTAADPLTGSDGQQDGMVSFAHDAAAVPVVQEPQFVFAVQAASCAPCTFGGLGRP